MSTRARASAGNGRGPVRARGAWLGAPSLARGRWRGRAADAGPLSPHPQAGGARRYAPSGTAVAHAVRLARPTAPGIVLLVKITVKGAPFGRVAARWRTNRAPLEQ
jgi:hypothetical protein